MILPCFTRNSIRGTTISSKQQSTGAILSSLKMASQNGINGNVHMYSGVNGNIMPSAGHYADMQTLMQNMENLSGWLHQNREEWSQVQDGLARVERMQV